MAHIPIIKFKYILPKAMVKYNYLTKFLIKGVTISNRSDRPQVMVVVTQREACFQRRVPSWRRLVQNFQTRQNLCQARITRAQVI